ncbi:MAG: DUF4870 domain-containing protein [Clostridia bacterium]|nr:DUF4870 domain-containing protein [Clostridia bacterium]
MADFNENEQQNAQAQENAQEQAQNQQNTQGQQQSQGQQNQSAPKGGILDTPDYTAQFTKEDVESNKVMAILAYIGILVLVPIFAAKESKFARFHANQGLVFLIVAVIAGAVSGIFGLIPYVGWIVGSAIGVCTLLLMIFGIVNAAQGRAKELPIIGKFRILK